MPWGCKLAQRQDAGQGTARFPAAMESKLPAPSLPAGLQAGGTDCPQYVLPELPETPSRCFPHLTGLVVGVCPAWPVLQTTSTEPDSRELPNKLGILEARAMLQLHLQQTATSQLPGSERTQGPLAALAPDAAQPQEGTGGRKWGLSFPCGSATTVARRQLELALPASCPKEGQSPLPWLPAPLPAPGWLPAHPSATSWDTQPEPIRGAGGCRGALTGRWILLWALKCRHQAVGLDQPARCCPSARTPPCPPALGFAAQPWPSLPIPRAPCGCSAMPMGLVAALLTKPMRGMDFCPATQRVALSSCDQHGSPETPCHGDRQAGFSYQRDARRNLGRGGGCSGCNLEHPTQPGASCVQCPWEDEACPPALVPPGRHGGRRCLCLFALRKGVKPDPATLLFAAGPRPKHRDMVNSGRRPALSRETMSLL